jgi:hypothetical protein
MAVIFGFIYELRRLSEPRSLAKGARAKGRLSPGVLNRTALPRSPTEVITSRDATIAFSKLPPRDRAGKYLYEPNYFWGKEPSFVRMVFTIAPTAGSFVKTANLPKPTPGSLINFMKSDAAVLLVQSNGIMLAFGALNSMDFVNSLGENIVVSFQKLFL